jgi:hypothetical protein
VAERQSSASPQRRLEGLGGKLEKRLKKLQGARLARSLRARVEIQPIGLGATIALKGSRGNVARSRSAVE